MPQTRRVILSSAGALLAVAAASLPAPPAWTKPRATGAERAIKSLDSDNDGTLDLAEVKATASALFDRLDKDRDGTLTINELQGRLSRKEFKDANPDNDGTLDKNEYLALVEKRFKAVNPDNDGTIDAKELATQAGRALLRLIK